MRLDPKYFNLFLFVCAALTAIVIIISTFHYASKQQETFKEELEDADLTEWNFRQYTKEDSLSIDELLGSPAVIHFWSTWSDLSLELHEAFQDFKREHPELIILAAASRDADKKVMEHIEQTSYDFIYIDGTPLYQDLMVPGLPSQIFVNREGRIQSQNVGKDTRAIKRKVDELLNR